MDAQNFARIISRASSGRATMMFLRGKVKVAGSLGFAAGFMGMFEYPRPEHDPPHQEA